MNNDTKTLIERFEKKYNVLENFVFSHPDKRVCKEILLFEIKSLQKQYLELMQPNFIDRQTKNK